MLQGSKASGLKPELHKIDDRHERFCVEARSAHERAIEFFLSHQSLNVVGLDASAVQNPQGGGSFGGELVRCTLAQKAMSRSGNFWRSGFTCANGPNRLVC
jgi:hypothetical protein